MSLQVDIMVDGGDWATLHSIEGRIELAIATAAATAAIDLADGAEVSVLLCDDATMRELNKNWRGVDKPTNVLSFPAATGSAIAGAPTLGDIAIAYETVAREAAAESKPLEDHVAHLTVHGFLHLIGFDHRRADEAAVMETLETRTLIRLGLGDPYAGTDAAAETE